MLDKERYKIDLPLISYKFYCYKNDCFYGSDLIRILPNCSVSQRKALYKIACYFRREFSYDFVQYSIQDDNLNKLGAFVFTQPCYQGYPRKDIVIGGCCFRYRKFTNTIDHWALQWIWLHPFQRNKGILTRTWPLFKKHFGDFYVEEPLSSAMKGFLTNEERKIHMDSDRLFI